MIFLHAKCITFRCVHVCIMLIYSYMNDVAKKVSSFIRGGSDMRKHELMQQMKCCGFGCHKRGSGKETRLNRLKQQNRDIWSSPPNVSPMLVKVGELLKLAGSFPVEWVGGFLFISFCHRVTGDLWQSF